MLSQLRIKNFAIIDELEVNFKDGLIVLTGETGAGKSIIVDALDFLLGARANTNLIKTGEQKAQVEGIFLSSEELKSWLDKNSFETDENQLIISRELSSQGSKARINGSIAAVSHLTELREYLIDIHEQSSHIDLLKIEKQIEILDSFGDKSHKKILEEYKKSFEEYQDLKNKLNNFLQNKEKIEKEIDYLKFQASEIKLANIEDLNEEEKLNSRREVLLNKKELIENSNLIAESIDGTDVETYHGKSLQEILTEIKKTLEKSRHHDNSFEPYLNMIENITDEIKDLSSFVNNYRGNINQDETALAEIEERLDLFYDLKRKYGKTLADIQQYLHKIEGELTGVETIHELSLLKDTFKQKEKEINELANKLTKSREKITRGFVNKINEELKTLGFKDVIFVVEFLDCELSSSGKENIQFLFSANPDEPPKPLLKVASGGELSRIMLAIKSIVCRDVARNVSTMVFDEIDIGTSGEIAASVAKKLYKISRQNQVISITHQPIIAAMADQHFVVKKRIKDGITEVFVREVLADEKSEALVSLLTPEGKEGLIEDAREFAESLLENARRIKEKELALI